MPGPVASSAPTPEPAASVGPGPPPDTASPCPPSGTSRPQPTPGPAPSSLTPAPGWECPQRTDAFRACGGRSELIAPSEPVPASTAPPAYAPLSLPPASKPHGSAGSRRSLRSPRRSNRCAPAILRLAAIGHCAYDPATRSTRLASLRTEDTKPSLQTGPAPP